MSSRSSARTLHPEIGKILEKRDIPYWALYRNQDPEAFLRYAIGLHGSLQDHDKDDKLIRELHAEEQIVKRIKSKVGKQRRLENNLARYRNWMDRLENILWEKGYKENNKYAPERRKSRMVFENE